MNNCCYIYFSLIERQLCAISEQRELVSHDEQVLYNQEDEKIPQPHADNKAPLNQRATNHINEQSREKRQTSKKRKGSTLFVKSLHLTTYCIYQFHSLLKFENISVYIIYNDQPTQKLINCRIFIWQM